MANPSKNYETTGGTVDGGGARPTDWTKLEGWTGGINPNGMYTNNVTSTPVLCKDGTTKNQPSSPTAKYADACGDNGGRAESQLAQTVKQELQTKKQESILSKISGNYGKNLLIVGAIMIGFLTYKKLKK